MENDDEQPPVICKMIKRNIYDQIKDKKGELYKLNKSYNPEIQKFAVETEYVEASNAAKIERILAKPFIKQLKHSSSVVTCMSCDPKQMSTVTFGTSSGNVQYWNIAQDVQLANLTAHEGEIKSVSYIKPFNFLTCGVDKIINRWDFSGTTDSNTWTETFKPSSTFSIAEVPESLDAQLFGEYFVVGTYNCIQLYKHEYFSKEPVHVYGKMESLNYHCVKFRQSDTNFFAALTKNNKIQMYDIRHTNVVKDIGMNHRLNAISFNPQYPVYFTVASDDYNCYSFDLRKLTIPIVEHKGHTKAVNDISYSHDGEEFVTGSMDKSIRIFRRSDKLSRDVYTLKRMSDVSCVTYTGDDRFIISSSMDRGIRKWKSKAAEKMGPLAPREKAAILESDRLRKQYSSHPEINTILNRRHLPNHIKHLTKEHRVIQQKKNRKQMNMINNSNVKKKFKNNRQLAMRNLDN